MLHFKLKHKDKEIPFQVAGSLDEVPFKTFLQYSDILDEDKVVPPIDLVSLFTDIDIEVWKQTNEIDMYTLVKTTIDQYDWSFKGTPETISINGKTIKVPRDIGYKSVGQFEDFNDYVRKLDVITNYGLLKTYPFLMAIYFQPEIDGSDYDYSRALKLAEDFKECSTYDIVRTVNFFLMKRLESEQNIKGSMKLNTLTTK